MQFVKNFLYLILFISCIFAFYAFYIHHICIPIEEITGIHWGVIFLFGMIVMAILIKIFEKYNCIKFVKNNKTFFLILLVIMLICLIYQLFFRYEYKVYKANKPLFAYTVKLDRLTGKTEIILNEQTKKYLKRKDKNNPHF